MGAPCTEGFRTCFRMAEQAAAGVPCVEQHVPAISDLSLSPFPFFPQTGWRVLCLPPERERGRATDQGVEGTREIRSPR